MIDMKEIAQTLKQNVVAYMRNDGETWMQKQIEKHGDDFISVEVASCMLLVRCSTNEDILALHVRTMQKGCSLVNMDRLSNGETCVATPRCGNYTSVFDATKQSICEEIAEWVGTLDDEE